MPGRKRLLRRIGVRADLSQMLVKTGGSLQTKMAPETGAIATERFCGGPFAWKDFRSKTAYFLGSETETGQVAIADGNAAAGGQQAVDGSHQAAEQGAGGQEADGCSLGHVVPFSWRGTIPLRDLGTI
jgi:hypothetical protein